VTFASAERRWRPCTWKAKVAENPRGLGAVTYVGLPVSSGGGHSLGRMSRRTAYERTHSFLEVCTEPVGAIRHFFRLYDPPGLTPIPRFQSELARRFGVDGTEPANRVEDVPAISERQVGDALDFLDDIDPQPANRWGFAPVWFWTTANFRILDPTTGHALPGQDPDRFHGTEYEYRVPLGTSGLRLRLSNNALALGATREFQIIRRDPLWQAPHSHWRYRRTRNQERAANLCVIAFGLAFAGLGVFVLVTGI